MHRPIRRLVAFDFDRTLIDTDSDDWVIRNASVEEWGRVLERLKVDQWTDLMDEELGRLHANGVTRAQLEASLALVSMHPSMIASIKLLASMPQTELIIISDANTFYVETILNAHKIRPLFSRIITNPAHFDEQGRLRIMRHWPVENEPHDCSVSCPPNMCKGKDLLEYIEERGGFDEVMYFGDSMNDFCPITKCSRTDTAFIRMNYTLYKALLAQPNLDAQVVAKKVFWKDGDDVLSFIERSIGGGKK